MTTPPITAEQITTVIDHIAPYRRAQEVKVSIFGADRDVMQALYRHPYDPPDPTDNGEYDFVARINGYFVVLRFQGTLGGWMVPLTKTTGTPYFYNPYVREAEAFLLVYDVKKRTTFEFIESAWRTLLQPESEKKPPIWVCAGGTERPQSQWEVSMEEAVGFCEKIGARLFTFSGWNRTHIDQQLAIEIATIVILKRIERDYVGSPSQILHPGGKKQVHFVLLRRLREKVMKALGRR